MDLGRDVGTIGVATLLVKDIFCPAKEKNISILAKFGVSCADGIAQFTYFVVRRRWKRPIEWHF